MDYNNLSFDINDMFGRKKFVQNLMRIVDGWDQIKHESESLVMSLDAPWGSGKSYLLNMWRNWLISDENSDKNYYVTYYNAWENDDCDNAFIPLVYKLQEMDASEEGDKVLETLKVKTKNFVKACGIALIKDTIKKTIGEETANLANKGIEGATKATAKSFFDKYRVYISEKDKFRRALSDLIPDDGKLIIFIDELDRCRPTFAIETLEIVKHYFDIKNIVFVFAIDLDQLSHSISTMYGVGMDSAGYLRRFFDININIPTGDINNYISQKLKNQINKLGFSEKFINIICNIYTKLNLSLRDFDKISNNFLIFCLYYKPIIDKKVSKERSNNIDDLLEVYFYFMTLKYKFPNIYYMILKQDFRKYDNQPANWSALEFKYFVSTNINLLLDKMQTGGAKSIDQALSLTYGMIDENSNKLSFAENVERTIEMFM
ncbi:KAP family P-loop NTPase fold protein [Clostridium estertheticum]|uniref:KAP family P-loop NTPase fold protein n=1 Tax=Clostridium estertheticum TaxID=238834 RepID=UPI001C0B0C9C|nr:P-loop NTPase fold protein [Clostridium estertheticum]MBU3174516.1 KAP family NTPase [Clostridium estertheticum]